MKLYIVRHGQTGYNIDNKVCGISDVELTSLGEQQAKMVERRSKFIGYIKPVQEEQEAIDFINEKKRIHWEDRKSVV